MQPVVLLAVAAVWAAVIVPPLLRSRSENRPNSSVSDFRRQLSTLQRTVPTRTMVPMRSMARPLTQSPHHRQVHQPQSGGMYGASVRQAGTRSHGIVRPEGADQHDTRAHHRQTHLHRISRREVIRRRRANILYLLGITVGISGFLSATTQSSGIVMFFGLSFVTLCGYCYKLVQIRSYEYDRSHADQTWFRAA